MLDNIEFIIPCAGKSTRNYPHSKGLAHKALTPLGSFRQIDHILKQIFDAGGRHVTIVCGDEATVDAFKEALSPSTDVAEKLMAKGRHDIAGVIKEIAMPSDADIKYVIQRKPLGTAHVLGLAHRVSPDRHGVMIFPDNIYFNQDPKNNHMKKILDVFAQNEKQILFSGIYQEDVSAFSILDNGRFIEKPKNPSNNIGGFAPFIFPKAIMDYMESKVEGLENGTYKPFMSGGEWVYTDGVNEFLDQDTSGQYFIKAYLNECDADVYMDTGDLPLYEKALLYALLKSSKFADENKKLAHEILSS